MNLPTNHKLFRSSPNSKTYQAPTSSYHYSHSLNDDQLFAMDETIVQEAENIEAEWLMYGGLWDEPVEGAPSPERQNGIRDRVINLWRYAHNWITMSELNRRFLQRRLPVCPSYGQPPEPETARFSSLLPLHDYGIITTNSCPGWVDTTRTTRQRAFLCFSIPTQDPSISSRTIYNFVQRLRQSTEVRTYIRFQYGNAPGWGSTRPAYQWPNALWKLRQSSRFCRPCLGAGGVGCGSR